LSVYIFQVGVNQQLYDQARWCCWAQFTCWCLCEILPSWLWQL